jgi:hypothetical protein
MFSDGMNRKVFVTSSWYDLAMSAPFALPITQVFVWGQVLSPVSVLLGFGELEPLDPHAGMFANFYGSIVMIWAVLRLYSGDVRLAIVDGIGRVLFAIAMVNALLHGATQLLWIFLVPEIFFCVLQIGGGIARRRSTPPGA